jgi:hypothetical protein
MIAATEQRAGAAPQTMIIDEHLTVSEAVQWCAGAISHREVARLRQFAGRAEDRPVSQSTLAANARRDDMEGEFIDRRRLAARWSSGVGNGLSRHSLRPRRGAHHPKREALCGTAGREDRDVRHQDRKHAFRAWVSREGAGKAGRRHVSESAGDSGEFLCPRKQGVLVEGSWSGTSEWPRHLAASLITVSQ